MHLPSILKTAKQAARAGGHILARLRRKGVSLDARNKEDGSVVTLADGMSSQAIHDTILQSDPSAFILDEEISLLHESERPDAFWVTDPLDGTLSYLHGGDDFCTLVAYVQKNTPVIGVLYFPMQDLMIFGGNGLGVWSQQGKNSKPTQRFPRRTPHLDQARLVRSSNPRTRDVYDRIAHALSVAQNTPRDSAGRMQADLIMGHADVIVTRRRSPCVWDVAAGEALLRELGGELTDLRGQPINYYHHIKLLTGSIAVIDHTLLPFILDRLPPFEELT